LASFLVKFGHLLANFWPVLATFAASDGVHRLASFGQNSALAKLHGDPAFSSERQKLGLREKVESRVA